MQGFVGSFRRYVPTLSNYSNSYRYAFPARPGLKLIGNRAGAWEDNFKAASAATPTPTPLPPPQLPPPSAPNKWYNFPFWAKFVLGTMVSLFLPFWKQNCNRLKKIEAEAELVAEVVESVAEVVEEAASATEKVAAEIAQKLPDDAKLKEAALAVEQISKVAAHDAHVAQDFMHKVDILKRDLNDVEKMVEPVVDKIMKL